MYLLFDIGGTKTRMATSLDGVNITSFEIVSTPQDFKTAMDKISSYILKENISSQDTSICLGLPGVFDNKKSMLVVSPNLPLWQLKPIKEEISSILRTEKVFLENDAALAGLAEGRLGAGKDGKIIAYLTLGTGIGGVRIVDGRIDTSTYGFEPGHQLISINNKIVDLSDMVSGAGLKLRYSCSPEDIKDPKIWHEVNRIFSIGLINTILHWSPDTVVLGGGLIKAGVFDLSLINENIHSYLKIFPVLPKIRFWQLGEEAGIKGALEYLKSV
jgi:predicted NBD/HSP70 family sugar kinase